MWAFLRLKDDLWNLTNKVTHSGLEFGELLIKRWVWSTFLPKHKLPTSSQGEHSRSRPGEPPSTHTSEDKTKVERKRTHLRGWLDLRCVLPPRLGIRRRVLFSVGVEAVVSPHHVSVSFLFVELRVGPLLSSRTASPARPFKTRPTGPTRRAFGKIGKRYLQQTTGIQVGSRRGGSGAFSGHVRHRRLIPNWSRCSTWWLDDAHSSVQICSSFGESCSFLIV